MADFEPLTDAEARAFDRFERMRDWTRRFGLLRIAARSRVRVAKAVAGRLTPSTRTRTKRLAALAYRKVAAYERLANLDGAVRFCAAQAARTAALAKVVLRP
jgi:hypothetical protein